jgi:hypothetical protein
MAIERTLYRKISNIHKGFYPKYNTQQFEITLSLSWSTHSHEVSGNTQYMLYSLEVFSRKVSAWSLTCTFWKPVKGNEGHRGSKSFACSRSLCGICLVIMNETWQIFRIACQWLRSEPSNSLRHFAPPPQIVYFIPHKYLPQFVQGSDFRFQ